MHPQQTDSTRRLSGRAGINVGAFGAVAPSLRLQGKCTDRVTLGLSSHFYRADNNYPFILQNGKITTHETRDHSHMQAYTVQGDLSATDQAGGKWQMLLFYNNDTRELPGQVMYYTQKGTEQLDEQRAFAQLRQERRWNDWKWMCAAKFSFSESLYDDTNPQYPTGALQQNYWQREWYATTGVMRTFRRFSAAYAADYTHTSLNSNQSAAPRAKRHSLQQALSLRYTHRVLTATARVQAYDDWNSCPVGEAAQNAHHISPTADVTAHLVSWHKDAEHWGRLRARVLYKESYRVPTFSETYYYHLGTQRLRPELARQTGAGLTLQAQPAPWWQNLEVSADAYFNHVRDRISAIPYNLYVWQTVNMGRVNIWGTDVTLHSTFRPAERHLLLLHTNYSWQKATDRTDPTSRSYGKQPAYMPQHTLGASLAWENPWANLSISLTALSERWSTNEHAAGTLLPAYAEWGVGAYREVKLPRGVRLNLRADVLNLFNKQYEIVRRYPMPGRHWKVGATIAF
jgi:outer membrane receptor protein involved in Fe transport